LHVGVRVANWLGYLLKQAPKMFTGRNKIVKAEGQQPDEFEEQVAQEIFNLEVSCRVSLFIGWSVWVSHSAVKARSNDAGTSGELCEGASERLGKAHQQ
jgi:hypothetical protein